MCGPDTLCLGAKRARGTCSAAGMQPLDCCAVQDLGPGFKCLTEECRLSIILHTPDAAALWPSPMASSSWLTLAGKRSRPKEQDSHVSVIAFVAGSRA